MTLENYNRPFYLIKYKLAQEIVAYKQKRFLLYYEVLYNPTKYSTAFISFSENNEVILIEMSRVFDIYG